MSSESLVVSSENYWGPIRAWAMVQMIIEERENPLYVALYVRREMIQEKASEIVKLAGSFDSKNMSEQDFKRIKQEIKNG